MSKAKVLGLIPARGGSKGVFRKNIRSLCGKPLIYWTIKAAKSAEYIDRVAVSTEDEEIAEISRNYGAEVPFIRPPELALDHSLRNEVISHALKQLPGFDFVILLQPTSPLRTNSHIDEAFEIFLRSKAKSCVSVVEQHPSPEWIFSMNSNNRLERIKESTKSTNRQALPKYYSLDGSIYITSVQNFFDSPSIDPFTDDDVVPYIMPKKYSVDIDDEEDFKLVELKFRKPII